MEVGVIVGLVLGGLCLNGVCYIVFDDVFEGIEDGLAKVHLREPFRLLAIIPFSYMLVLCTLMALLISAVFLVAIVRTFVVDYKGLCCLVVGRGVSE